VQNLDVIDKRLKFLICEVLHCVWLGRHHCDQINFMDIGTVGFRAMTLAATRIEPLRAPLTSYHGSTFHVGFSPHDDRKRIRCSHRSTDPHKLKQALNREHLNWSLLLVEKFSEAAIAAFGRSVIVRTQIASEEKRIDPANIGRIIRLESVRYRKQPNHNPESGFAIDM
jgi:hypothetical protein